MRMGYGLELRQSQKLIMTPQLEQAIRILQLASFELEQYIQQEIETNPVLELHTDTHDSNVENKDQTPEEEINWKEYLDDIKNPYHNGKTHNDNDDFNYEHIVPMETSLQDHLLFQYHITVLDPRYNEIGEYIINNLNENGYLTLSVEEIAKELNENIDIVENILQIIQTFDPIGIAARDLRECLLIQLRQIPGIDDRIFVLVDKYLQAIADNKFPHIAKEMGITPGEVQEMCDFLKTLEPKPGRKFGFSNNNYLIPDVEIRKIGNEFIVISNERNGPRLRIRDDYRTILADENGDVETIKFLNDKLNSALWLIRSIEQRRETIYKVVEMILEKQKDFFKYGKNHLKPMTLKEVADGIQVHESTVSRATNGKYVDTPMGIFELKHFFSSGVEMVDGEGISAESIKNYIKEIIEAENSYKPLSDEAICQKLLKKEINISRRTVAKYRNDLNIPSSSKRKRY